MFNQGLFILSFVVALGVSFILTPLMRRIAIRYNLFALPSRRKIHSKPIPYLGGVAMYAGFTAGIAVIMLSKLSLVPALPDQIIGILLAATFIVVVGIWDDAKDIRPWLKLLGQAIAAAILFYSGLRIELVRSMFTSQEVVLPLFLSMPFTLLWFIVMMNALNLIDGLDGLAAGITVIVSSALIVINLYLQNYINIYILAALSGASLGFLRYNFHPAVIFMGDAGSMLLGLLLSSVALIGYQHKTATAAVLLTPLTALAIPVYDTFASIVRRLAKKQSIFRADKKHLHHRLLKLGLSQKQIVIFLYLVTLYLSLFAFLFVLIPQQYAFLLLLLLALGAGMGIIVVGFIEDKLRSVIRRRKIESSK